MLIPSQILALIDLQKEIVLDLGSLDHFSMDKLCGMEMVACLHLLIVTQTCMLRDSTEMIHANRMSGIRVLKD